MEVKGGPKTGRRRGDFADKSIVLCCLGFTISCFLGGNINNLEELGILKIWDIPNNQKGHLIYVDLQMTHHQRKHEDISTVEDCWINLAWTSLCYQSSPIKSTYFAGSSKKYDFRDLFISVCVCV
jgi:hypothetical protein